MVSRRDFLKLTGASTAAMYLATRSHFLQLAYGATQVNAVPLPGNQIPQFVDPLPDLLVLTSVTDGPFTIRMQEFQADVMPSTYVPAVGVYGGTWVWSYQTDGHTPPSNTYINPVIVAQRDNPTQITWVNELGTGAGSQLYWQDWTDQTLHWAMGTHSMNHYTSQVPAVPHLHGGEVPPQLDGGPDAWFTPDGQHGHAYYDGPGGSGGKTAKYIYPNTQEGATIWFHDHALGITRINVYAGLAGAYLIEDGNHPSNLPDLIPLVIQDRMFDVNGQLYFPNIGDNPLLHPFWVPEFIGDTIVVNGKVWPYKAVDRQRYTLLFLDGSNARFYDMFLIDPVSGVKGPPMYVISTDGGYLDNAVLIDPNATGQQVKAGVSKSLVVGPGERYQAIVDFNDATWINNLTAFYGTLPAMVNLQLRNNARTPFPDGVPSPKNTTGRVMEFRVDLTSVTDNSYNPAQTAAVRTTPIIQLTTESVTRQLTLNEVMGPAGPYEALVNNTKWDGHSVATDVFPTTDPGGHEGVRPDFVIDPSGNSNTYYSELPVEGTTELWEIINMTADAHPIHLHLVQFQLVNRQDFDAAGYAAVYDALFPASTAIDPATGLTYPGGVFIGGFGPPAHYDTGQSLKKTGTNWNFDGPQVTTYKGGNPDVEPFLAAKKGVQIVQPPLPHEAGWKDTVIMYPGQVTRIRVRWAPTHLPTNTPAAQLHFPFDPNGGHGFVWHCHIIDHEDNEMMRPDSVVLNPAAPGPAGRPLEEGIDY